MSGSKKIPYDKVPLSEDQLLEQLQERGLIIDDLETSRHYLRFIGYYRLTGYLRCFQDDPEDRVGHTYKQGTSFSQILNHYIFDRELRVLIFNAIERIEVAFKSAISDTMSVTHNDSHWFMREELFTNPGGQSKTIRSHEELLSEVREQVRRSKRQRFISHYYQSYSTPKLPHSWATFEVLDFGLTSKIYQAINPRDRDQIAALFKCKRATLESWMRALSTLDSVVTS